MIPQTITEFRKVLMENIGEPLEVTQHSATLENTKIRTVNAAAFELENKNGLKRWVELTKISCWGFSKANGKLKAVKYDQRRTPVLTIQF